MVSTKLMREVYSAETQQLLKEKGLQCICELCDCGGCSQKYRIEGTYRKTKRKPLRRREGYVRRCVKDDGRCGRWLCHDYIQSRHHRHEGCTKTSDKIKTVLQRPGYKECSTDYQSSYQAPPCNFVRKIRRPLPRLRNPNPPPMDFRTVTNTEYVQHGNFEGPPKPLKLEDNYHGVPNEEFDGQTSYAVAYTNHGQPSQVKLTRPVISAAQKPKYKFSDETTHNATFSAKKAEPTTSFTELPSFMGSILYPDRKSSNLRTVNQEAYQGKFAPKSKFCGPRETTINLGTEGEYEHETEHRATYKKHAEDRKRSPKVKKPVLKLGERVKFDATTQAQSDFPSYKKGEFPAPAKPCPPYPATINLALNSSHDFTTTNKERYKGQWDVNLIKVKPKESRYTPPKEKFHTTTQTMADFKPKETSRVRITKPVQTFPSNKIKLSEDTSYKTQFPKYEGLQGSFKRYGDFHEQGFYLRPIQKFQGDSVTTKDFKQHEDVRPRSSFKPKQELSAFKGEMSGESEYRTTYKQKEVSECAYIKYLAEHNKTLAPKKVVTV